MSKNEELEYHVLSKLKIEDMPAGAVLVHGYLEDMGISLSETGVSRLLRMYRKDGYLEKMGNQGHVLTDLGRKRIEQLETERALRQTLGKLTGNERGEESQILDVLIARRAIEVEAAYRAAINATDRDIEKLEEIIKAQYKEMEQGLDYAKVSGDFHRTVLKISRVPLLETLYDFIGLSTQWQNFFIGTFKHYNTPLNVPHEEIYKAIKMRNPEEAVKMMTSHMDKIIENAKRLMSQNKL